MDTPTAAAGDVLAQPTRTRLFARLAELKREAGTEELAAWSGLHVNGVRRHLERLREAGLIERTKTRHGRGRPRDGWAISAHAKPAGERPKAYVELARWLASAMPPDPQRLRHVRRAGREIGRGLAPETGERSAAAFTQVLTALGFQPQLTVDEGGSACCRLGNCPYTEAVRENAEVVCTLHEGITAGLLEQIAPGARLTRFEPRDPVTAGCLIEIAATDWHGEPEQESKAARK